MLNYHNAVSDTFLLIELAVLTNTKPMIALKNTGRPDIAAILKERERGLFKSLFDFKSRVRNVNKKSMESLVKAGAFSSFEKNVDVVLKTLCNEFEEKQYQENLFHTFSLQYLVPFESCLKYLVLFFHDYALTSLMNLLCALTPLEQTLE